MDSLAKAIAGASVYDEIKKLRRQVQKLQNDNEVLVSQIHINHRPLCNYCGCINKSTNLLNESISYHKRCEAVYNNMPAGESGSWSGSCGNMICLFQREDQKSNKIKYCDECIAHPEWKQYRYKPKKKFNKYIVKF